VALIFQAESRHSIGIVLGLASAFFAAWFSVLNARYSGRDSAFIMAAGEMFGGWIVLSLVLFVLGRLNTSLLAMSVLDWAWLAVLAGLCTGYAFAAMVYIMRSISAFSVNLSLSLEPVYGMAIAASVFGADERLGGWAYVGLGLLLAAIALDLWMKQRASRTPLAPA